ncbi:hypothetical protein EZV62_015187 [Acer yangbiense]|uniref:DUF4283 domain-containing protein n=1 Tax=Acer yangbiense TaxID=1000413 RepID=A0A5C7HUZ9_9ROSI|nr:hypothetical protein EZV62_015187 [Acer yangbiense]
MDSQDIASLCASLSITERDGPVREGFEIESVTGNIFTFHFKSEEDRQRVISGGPWSFDNALMVLAKLEGNGTIESIQFIQVDFWVQIHQVPILCMTRKIGFFLGSIIGEVLEVDGGNAGNSCGYERLPNHYFKCGMVDHNTNECSSSEQCPVVNGVESLQFGIWDIVVASTGRKQAAPTTSGGGWRNQQDQKSYAKEVVNSQNNDTLGSQPTSLRPKNVGTSGSGKNDDLSQTAEPMIEEIIEGSIEVTGKKDSLMEIVEIMNLPFNDQDIGHVKDIGLDKAPIPDLKLYGGPIQFPYKEVQQEGLGHHCADPSSLDEKMKNDGPIGENSLHEPRLGENIGLLRKDLEVVCLKPVLTHINTIKHPRWVRKIRDRKLGEVCEKQLFGIGKKRGVASTNDGNGRRKFNKSTLKGKEIKQSSEVGNAKAIHKSISVVDGQDSLDDAESNTIENVTCSGVSSKKVVKHV